MSTFDNIRGTDSIDVRDIIERIEELDQERVGLVDAVDDAELETNEVAEGPLYDAYVSAYGVLQAWLASEEGKELEALQTVMAELQGAGGDEQWEGHWYPLTLIHDSYFTNAMRELVSDIGDLPAEVPSYIEIDWEATAKNLQVDYTSIEVDGVTYWFR